MSGILGNILRSNVLKTASMSVLKQSMDSGMNNSVRGLSHMTKNPGKYAAMNNSWHKSSFGCSCGCGIRFKYGTEGSAELLDIIEKEIEYETKAARKDKIPTNIGGFEVKYDNVDIELVKQEGNERIEVTTNINKKLDVILERKPTFIVNIIKDGTTLSFRCEVLRMRPRAGEYDDKFGIQEVTIFRGEYNDKKYACAGDLFDSYLYDLFMSSLDKRGITNDLVSDLNHLHRNYERILYKQLLESLKAFA